MELEREKVSAFTCLGRIVIARNRLHGMTWGNACGEEEMLGQVPMEGQKSGRGGTMSNKRKIEELTNDKTGYLMVLNLKRL